MGHALDTNETFEFVLLNDKDGPEGVTPTFLFRFLSVRQYTQMVKLLNDSRNEKLPFEKTLAKILEAVRIPLAGWRDMGREYNASDLEEVVTTYELLEMRERLPVEMTFSEADKKKSKSALRHPSDKSASSTATPANAGTAGQ